MEMWQALNGALGYYSSSLNLDINEATNPYSVACLLGEVSHETDYLNSMVEYCATNTHGYDYQCIDNYQAGSWCLVTPVAGQYYYGRGCLQLSWDCNYAGAGTALGVDLLSNPNLVATNNTLAWASALWFWSANGIDVPASTGNYAGVTRIINPDECCSCVPSVGTSQYQRGQRYLDLLTCMGLPTNISTSLIYC